MKLKAMSVRCRLLGWWADETKGYCLEEVETGKQLTSRDVRFVEDTQPREQTVVEGGPHPLTRTESTVKGPTNELTLTQSKAVSEEGSKMMEPVGGALPVIPTQVPQPL